MKHIRLLLLCMMLLCMITAVAQEIVSSRVCRRGTPREQSSLFRRTDDKQRIPGGDYYHGERHQLTILVNFNDRQFQDGQSAVLEKWSKIFNAENYHEGSFVGSVHDYFMDQSYGKFNLTFDLEYIQVSGNAERYASNAYDDENSQFLVDDIVDELKKRDIDWAKYDWNDDGYINQLLIIYPGYGMNESKDSNLIWPHQWWMSEHLKEQKKGSYRTPLTVTDGNKNYQIDCYCALNELSTRADHTPFGTICHEYTHCFGMPDFYSGSVKGLVGNWDLMGSGNYNGKGYVPAGFSAHERWLMGWITPIELTEPAAINDIPALAEEGRAYLVRNEGHENEYYIIENRQPVGWDAEIPGSGILVFHIDYDPSVWTSTTSAPNSYFMRRYELFYANNSPSLFSEWAYPYGETNQLTNTSTPAAKLNNLNIDGSRLMSKPITDMTVAGGLASFSFIMPSTTGVGDLTAKTAPEVLCRLGMVDVVRDAQGHVRKKISARR